MKGRRRCVGQQESCGFDFPTGALLSFHVLLISLDSRQVHSSICKWRDFQPRSLIFTLSDACALLLLSGMSCQTELQEQEIHEVLIVFFCVTVVGEEFDFVNTGRPLYSAPNTCEVCIIKWSLRVRCN